MTNNLVCTEMPGQTFVCRINIVLIKMVMVIIYSDEDALKLLMYPNTLCLIYKRNILTLISGLRKVVQNLSKLQFVLQYKYHFSKYFFLFKYKTRQKKIL